MADRTPARPEAGPVTPTKTAAPSARHGGPDAAAEGRPRLQSDWLGRTRGHRVSVRLLDGKALVGTLLDADQYCLALAVAGRPEPVLIFKHGVSCLVRQEGAPE